MDFIIRVCCSIAEIRNRIFDLFDYPVNYSIKGRGLDYEIWFTDITEDEKDAIFEIFADVYYAEGEGTLAETLVSLLYNNGLVISFAESITGGMISSSIVDIPGCSDVFYEGVVSYSNGAKIDRLGVGEDTLLEYGAVSEETAIEMANGLLKDNVGLGVSCTGIAGPTGGSDAKPVGLVYIAVVSREITECHRFMFEGTRNDIREKTKDQALFLSIEHIRDNF
ncbi:MAG TPA: CinA family protein [Clostridia bacterium]|jgi:nicotinamide-nucleotide amidase|nr:CinA family protein [Clostridia bacterium]